ncbi:isopeptide-forming domain-containing fimbrial protein, partial [Agaribacter marinus]|nr:isopeptide-forming domain-containing fimbrial protein [Agaribacter marinus]
MRNLNVHSRRNDWIGKKFLIVLMTIFIIYSQMSSYIIYAMEDNMQNEPVVATLDVDGVDSKEVIKSEDYTYNVNVVLPKDISGYETMIVSDTLDQRLAVQGTKILVDGEEETLEVITDGQEVSLELMEDQLQELTEKELKLQITVQIQEKVDPGEKIENMAKIVVNANPAIETNPVTMILSKSELDTGEGTEEEQQTSEEPTERNEAADKVIEDEKSDSLENEEDVTVAENSEELKMATKSEEQEESLTNDIQPLNTSMFEINRIDSYGSSSDSTFNRIYQFDGNDPTIVKGFIDISGLPANINNLNALAVSEEGYIYVRGRTPAGSLRLYRIDGDGQATLVTPLERDTVNASIYGDKYYYITYNNQNNPFIEYVNVKTGETGRTPLVNNTGVPLANLGADMIIDSDGYMWVTQKDTLVQINPNTSEILRVTPVPGLDSLEYGVRGLSFLPDGDVLVSVGEGNRRPLFYEISQVDGTLTNLGRMTDLSPEAVGDLGSSVTPYFDPYPPKLESEKQVQILEKGGGDSESPEAGDILLYKIQARNTIESPSILKGLTISDKIPEGLEYIPGTLTVDGQSTTDVEDGDWGQVVEGEILGEIGDVLDTEWHTVEFEVKVLPDRMGDTIQNVATVDGLNVDPQYPEAEITIIPAQVPVMETNKSVTIEKAAGNTDTLHAEAGDTLIYKVLARNTVDRSIIENMTISDTILPGLVYQDGSLTVDGQPVTDTAGDDAGQMVNNVVSGQIGDVVDTEWHEIEFKVTVSEELVGARVINTASVTGNNVEEQHPQEEIPIYPLKDTPDACSAPIALVNGGFEEPAYYTGHPDYILQRGWADLDASKMVGWKTTDPANLFEIMGPAIYEDSTNVVGPGLDFYPAEGEQFAELNSRNAAQLYQDIVTVPGQTIYWRVAHRARVADNLDTMTVRIGSSTIAPENLPIFRTVTSDETQWHYYQGVYTVPSGQTSTRFGFEAVGGKASGNFLDDLFLGSPPCVVLEKTVSPEGEVYAGDEITYEVNIKNQGGDIAADAIFQDMIPEGTEYIADSLKIIEGPESLVGDLTDAVGDDAGEVDDSQITIGLGDVPNTQELPDGITVQFKVKAMSSHVNDTVMNQAETIYTNLFDNTLMTANSNEVTTPILPVEITLMKDVDKSIAYVGNILTYTIEAVNESPSGVWNGTIEDMLPAGLELVAGSTQLNGEALEDADIWNEGKLRISEVEVKAGETATIMFQVEVLESALNTTVENIAMGHDPEDPENPIETPPTETEVVPDAGELVADKAVYDAEGTSIDGEEVAVGDELTYTITTENIGGPTTIVNNVTVVDDIPAGLSYVPGTLTVNGESYADSYVSGQVVTIDDIGSLVGGDRVEVSFSVVVTEEAKGTVTNIATVTGEVPGEDPEDPNEPETPTPPETTVDVPADITLTKAAEQETAYVGDVFAYTIEATNGDTGGVWNGTIEDTLPVGLELVAGSTQLNGEALEDADIWNEGKLRISEVEVKAGETATIMFQV